MSASKVYFTDMRTSCNAVNLRDKLENLLQKAGFESIDFAGKFTAIKLNFGEMGNLAYLRANYARYVCDYVKRLGGRPFVTDCNTLYVGSRKNALEHLDCAYENGYNPFCTGVHTIIADGLKGTDEVYIPVRGGEYVKEAKIGRAIADADIIISLNHFKGHEQVGFGGAVKNIGMGCGSRAGKMEMHAKGRPFVDQELCVGCGKCSEICAHGAAVLADGKAQVLPDRCAGCGRCIGNCPADAMTPAYDASTEELGCRIAEYAKAVVQDKPSFHINLAIDISPYCDCHSENDVPIVSDIGMFASFDPVAIDVACADAVNAEEAEKNSVLHSCEHTHGDHFSDIFPNTDWRAGMIHSEKIGLGQMEYELIPVTL